MCIFGTPKQQELPAPAAAPAPTPSPTPSQVSPIQTADQQRKQLAAMRYGLASTIKTSPQGVLTTPAQQMYGTTQTGKQTLGT